MSNDGDDERAGDAQAFVEPTEEGEDGFDFDDEMTEAFGKPSHTFYGGHYTTDAEAMPHLRDDGDVADAHAPPFLRENQVCIADRTRFVVRGDHGEIVSEHPPSAVTRYPDGEYRARMEGKQTLLRVEPIRRECVHYVRQIEPPAPSDVVTGKLKRGWMNRYCAARRSTSGAFMVLTNRAMSACSLRDPYDAESQARLDEFDDTAEERSRDRVHLDMFNLTQGMMRELTPEETKPS